MTMLRCDSTNVATARVSGSESGNGPPPRWSALQFAGRGVEATLVGDVDPPRARAEDFADPVGREVGPCAFRTGRHPLAAPAREIRDQHVGAEVQFRLEQDPPAARAAATLLKR